MSEYTPHNWVNNETITAEKLNNIEQGIASASSNVGGLIVHVTRSSTINNGYTITIDKTWQEIFDAVASGAYIQIVEDEEDCYTFYMLIQIFMSPSENNVTNYIIEITGTNNYLLLTDSPNSYPSYTYTPSSTPAI